MSEITFPDNSHLHKDDDQGSPGNQFTVEQWIEITKDWLPQNAIWAKFASHRSYEERQAIVNNLDMQILFGHVENEIIDHAVLFGEIWALSDDGLNRLIQALTINEMIG